METYIIIPKVIHYCWFGHREKPEYILKCIDSWKKFLPDYEIREWNESNFNVDIVPYTNRSYALKKYGQVVDYARFYLLHKYGGLFLDPELEIIRQIDDIIESGAFVFCDKVKSENDVYEMLVEPALGMGAPAGFNVCRDVLDYYDNLPIQDVICDRLQADSARLVISRILLENSVVLSKDIVSRKNVSIYPIGYAAFQNFDPNKLIVSNNTRCIRHLDDSISEWYHLASGKRGPVLRKCFGERMGNITNKVIFEFQKNGFCGAIRQFLNYKWI